MMVYDRGIAYQIEISPNFDFWEVFGKFVAKFKRLPRISNDILTIAGPPQTESRLLSSSYYAERHETWFKDFVRDQRFKIWLEDTELTSEESEVLAFFIEELPHSAIVDQGWYDVSSIR